MGIRAWLRYYGRRLYLRYQPKSATRKESFNSKTVRRHRTGMRPLLKCVVFLIVAATSGLGFFRECIDLAKYVRMIRTSPRRLNWNDSPLVLDTLELSVRVVGKLLTSKNYETKFRGSLCQCNSPERVVNMFDGMTFAPILILSNVESFWHHGYD